METALEYFRGFEKGLGDEKEGVERESGWIASSAAVCGILQSGSDPARRWQDPRGWLTCSLLLLSSLVLTFDY